MRRFEPNETPRTAEQGQVQPSQVQRGTSLTVQAPQEEGEGEPVAESNDEGGGKAESPVGPVVVQTPAADVRTSITFFEKRNRA